MNENPDVMGHIEQLKQGTDEQRCDSVLFFFYTTRAGCKVLLTIAKEDQHPQSQKAARENLEALRDWLNEEMSHLD